MTGTPDAARKTVRHSGLRRPNIPALGIGATLAAMSALLGSALKMAYVDPYAVRHRRPQADLDDNLDGRNPGW